MTESTMCPRCGQPAITVKALSRTTRAEGDTPVYVCSPCGADEAMEEFINGHNGATPRKEWPIR